MYKKKAGAKKDALKGMMAGLPPKAAAPKIPTMPPKKKKAKK